MRDTTSETFMHNDRPSSGIMTRAFRMALMLAGTATATCVVPAWAQTGEVVVMRKAIDARTPGSVATPPGSPATTTPTTPPKPGDPDYYSWTVTDWVQSGACGTRGTETREVACRNTLGRTAPDVACTGNGSGPRPIASRAVTVTQTCGYAWNAPDWPMQQGACGAVVQNREVTCMRSDGTLSALCSAGSKPAESRTVEDVSGCGYLWTASAWSAPSTTCGRAEQTRSVVCLRTDGKEAPAAKCTGTAPETTQTTDQTSGCATSWATGEWTQPAACGTVTQSRTVVCRRKDGQTAADAECTQPKPETTRETVDRTTCPATSYAWRTGEFGSPSTTCGMATLTRSVDCAHEDGTTVSDAKCTAPKPSATTERKVVSRCGYEWQADADYGDPVPACGNTVRTRGVRCVRGDGEIVESGRCEAETRPTNTTPATDYSACGFGWTTSAWSAFSESCGAAVRTRTVSCQRSDGASAADAQCSSGTRPEASENSYQTSGCQVSWHTGDYGPPAPACGPSPQTRSVTCLRSDGQTVADEQCAVVGDKPDATIMGADHSTCTFSWTVGAFTTPTTSCGTSVQTRSVRCARSDVTYAEDASCAAAGDKPATTETTTQTSGCTYAWKPSPWGASAPACGPSVRSRTVDCARSDGTVVETSYCPAAKPATSEAISDYSTCSYNWQVSQWKGASTVCGDTITQTRSVSCLRSEGTTVGDGSCTAAKPAASQTISDYSGCSYAWQTTTTPWSSTCSASAKRTNTSVCRRSDGVEVDDTFCTAAKPPATETQGVYSSCSYTPTYSSTYNTCVAVSPGSTSGKQSAALTKCMRSDGTDVTATNASGGYANCAASTSKSCSITYTPTYSTAYGACSGGMQSAAIATCTQSSDNASVSVTYCSPQTTSRTCTPAGAAAIVNGNFEGTTGWTFSGTADYGTVSSRGAVLRPNLPSGSTTASASQTLSTSAGSKYTVTYTVTWMGGGGYYCSLSGAEIKDAGGTALASDVDSICTGSKTLAISFVAKSSSTKLSLVSNAYSAGYSTMTGFDNVSIVAN